MQNQFDDANRARLAAACLLAAFWIAVGGVLVWGVR
jgi:hypothetical protein